ncbi:hypothetical protein NEMBOFW57_004611 [Staphylotrichum longicolle]|uniref:O-methyltransferase domain-containing protein n=1 Tax=Staphylotrichum longicolle TaxID=669026 RepID=A0AAD4F759_9PEZI|nr:hypothetical protein NEMBOFW57_004611 [Staphylotrichum longicolle]
MTTADQLISNLKGIDATSFANDAERIRARDAIFEAFRRHKSPWDIAWDHNWVNPAINACIKTLSDAGVFTKWAEAGGEPITCSQLENLTGADALLIRRMMRALAGQCLVTEVGHDTYARTPWAKALTGNPPFACLYGATYHEVMGPGFVALPSYLKKTNYRNPTDCNDCNLQFWRGQPGNLFDFIQSNPLLRSDFNDAMVIHSQSNLMPWVDVYPTETIIAAAEARPTQTRPLVVDVGGGKGHDLKKFLATHRGHVPAGSLVLLDLPEMLKDVDVEFEGGSAIIVQTHDFFNPYPDSVKGARAYFMHTVLHDWPDETARQILQQLVPAMEKGYSRLLIHEHVVSSERPSARVTVLDITMMAFLAAAERTEEQWRDLVESVGLRVVKIWRTVQGTDSIVEAEVS